MKFGCCYFHNPSRWEPYFTIFFTGCTKQGEMLLEQSGKSDPQSVMLYQREDFLYILNLEGNTLLKMIKLKNVVPDRRTGKDANDKGLELCYNSSETSYSIKFFSTNEEEVQSWISSISQYNSMEKFFEKYKIAEVIGTGKVAILYNCMNIKSKKEYAVKSLEKVKLPQSELRFLNNEIALTKELSHKNIVKCIEVMESKTHVYIVMEKVSGGELFEYMEKKKFFSEFECCYIIYHVIKALHYLHSSRIIHRDIKPENILLEFSQDKESVVGIKLIDFGLACMLRPKELLMDTCGTLSFIAPEVIKRVGYDAKVDMWAVGIMCLLMLQGVSPFYHPNNKEVLNLVVNKEVRFDESWQGYSEDCISFVRLLVNKNPLERMSSEQALTHPWITKNRPKILSLKSKYYKENPKQREMIDLEDYQENENSIKKR